MSVRPGGREGMEAPAFRFRQELQARRLIPTLATALVVGILEVVIATSFAALIFAGPLSRHLPAGIGVNLFAGAVVLALIAMLSTQPGTVGSIQDVSAAILALVSAAIARRVHGTDDAAFLTVLAAIGLTTLLAGGLFFVLGTFRLGELVRFVPYPVVGGFLAGTGWLLVKGGTGIMAGTSVSIDGLSILIRPGVAARWLPGLALAVMVLLAMRRYPHFMIIPGSLVGAVALFHVVLLATGTPVQEAEAEGWLLGSLPSGGLWRALLPSAVSTADWSAVLSQTGNVLTVLIVALLALLLNATSIELMVNRDVDLNPGTAGRRGGQRGGGPGWRRGGIPGAQPDHPGPQVGGEEPPGGRVGGGRVRGGASVRRLGALALPAIRPRRSDPVPRPRLPDRMGVRRLVQAGPGGLPDRLGDPAHGGVRRLPPGGGPRPGGGRRAVRRQLQPNRRGEAHPDGSRICEQRRAAGPAPGDPSPKRRADPRPPAPGVHLLRNGELRVGSHRRTGPGPGTSPPALPRPGLPPGDRSRLLGGPLLRQGAQVRRGEGIHRGLHPSVGRDTAAARSWRAGGFRGRAAPEVPRPRPRHAVVRGSGAPAEGMVPDGEAGTLWAQLQGVLGETMDVARLLPYLTRVEVPQGHHVIRQGEPADDVYLLESGRITAGVDIAGREGFRLRTMGPGAVVGELPLYLGTVRTASVIAETPSTLYRLTTSDFHRMERDDPDLAAALHRVFARLLAQGLADSMETMRALLD